MRIHLIAVLGLLATPAFAQDQWMKVDDRTPVESMGINADLVDDLDVVNAQGIKIGEIDEVLGTSRDKVEAFVIDFKSSAKEYGKEDRIVPVNAFTFDGSDIILTDTVDVSTLPVWDF